MAGTGASLKGLASRGTPRSLQWEVSSGKMVRRRAAVGKGNGGVPEDERYCRGSNRRTKLLGSPQEHAGSNAGQAAGNMEEGRQGLFCNKWVVDLILLADQPSICNPSFAHAKLARA